MTRDNGWPLFVAGLGVGAVVGLLLTPKSGGEIRTRLGKAIQETADNLNDQAERVIKRGGTSMTDADVPWRRSKKAMSDVKDKIDDVTRGTTKIMDEVVETIEHATQR